jgi:hypothetical protein
MVKEMQVIESRFGRFRILAQLGLALATMAVLLALSGSPSASEPLRSRPPLGAHRESHETAHRIEALYAGIPQHGEELGNPRAPVTLQFFGDLECPEAMHFALGALPFIVRRWVRSGKLRILYHAYPAETIWHDIFTRQQTAALAAGEQDRLWQYLDFFYHSQGPEYTRYATAHFLEAVAEEVRGLDFARWQADRFARPLARQVVADLHLTYADGIRETPAFLIGPTGGRAKQLFHFSLLESRAFDEAVEAALKA